MDQQQFVDALNAYVATTGAEDALEQWKSPTGRTPSQEKLAQAAWFNNLSANDRQMVEAVAGDTAQATLFGVLCVLDGVRRIDPSDEAHFELARVENGNSKLLASSDLRIGLLHELL